MAADRSFFSGKHRCHGMNLQVIAGPAGQLLWMSGVLPGLVHEMTAAWIWGIERELAAAGLPALADKGYQGAAHAKIPYRAKGNPNLRKRLTVPMPNSGHPVKGQTRSSKNGRFSAGYAAAPGQIAKAVLVLQAHETKTG